MPKKRTKSEKVPLPEIFLKGWSEYGFKGKDSLPIQEYKFHKKRLWRFDLAWKSLMVAVELDGWGPGHMSIKGREADNEKQNAASALGWIVLRYNPSSLVNSRIQDTIEQVCAVLELSNESKKAACKANHSTPDLRGSITQNQLSMLRGAYGMDFHWAAKLCQAFRENGFKPLTHTLEHIHAAKA